ncbi:hypothetical protein [Pseudomonas sp. DrBHI1]|jgi:hypothetical protein|uniref:DUF7878 domain-containing protein n=1 Tax=Pseudomonas sp. DrBHI1 TaxID=2006091 RepID=UPI000B5980C6|nr:hypothetical protein [Pseudomonas sp. DrBHI1]OWQ37565.1 hypothetical protein CC207_03325 [Pseudomonas sp. DrBHI1]
MKVDFELLTLPDDMSGYNAAAFTEGRLRIEVKGQVFLQVEYCLLLELANVMTQWLKAVATRGAQDFYYASMDEEEEPIIALRYCRTRSVFSLWSCWAVCEHGPDVTLEQASECFERYVHDLKRAIDNRLQAVSP